MTASLYWTVWGLEASLTLTNPACLDAAESIVRQVIAEVERACSRFDPDSELQRLQPSLAAATAISPMLSRLVRHGLEAATWTGGAVDPTLGRDLENLGYDRDLISVQLHPRSSGTAYEPMVRRTPGWKRVQLQGTMLTVPGDLRLDLGATAKADAADLAAVAVAEQTGSGVLVCLGGDIATAGEGPEGGWQVMVQDLETDPAQQVTLQPGQALATSSTQKRRWQRRGKEVHHILDPRFGLPALEIWRSVTVAAATCLQANAYSTAGIVKGLAAPDWFSAHGIAARLIDANGDMVATGGWPGAETAPAGAPCHG